jgi:uncharacterized protein YoxC
VEVDMTANQLQYAANKINEQATKEQARHNEAIEKETNRNNLEITRINDAANAINAQRNEIQEDYNNRSLEIDKAYKEQYLALQKAQGDEANRIKAQLADTEQEKMNLDAWYKLKMSTVAENEADIKQQLADETETHNRLMEDIQRDVNVLTRRQQNILEKYNTGMLQYYGGVLQNQQIKTQNEYQLGLWNTQLGMYNTKLALMNYKLSEKSADRKFGLDIINTGLGALKTGVNAAVSAFGFGGLGF